MNNLLNLKLICESSGPNGGSKPKNVATPQMVQRILQLKQNNNTIYAHEIRTELQKEFGKIVDSNYLGPAIPSISSINRILRQQNLEATNSFSGTTSSQQFSSASALQPNQLSSFYYSALNSPFSTPASTSGASSFGKLYSDPFATSSAPAATVNSSFSSSGYSSSGSNSPVGSSSGSSSPNEFSTAYTSSSFNNFRSNTLNYQSDYHLINDLLTNKQSNESKTNSESIFNQFHCTSTANSTTNLQPTTSLFFNQSTSQSKQKKSRKYTSFNINEILRKESSEEDDVDVDDDF